MAEEPSADAAAARRARLRAVFGDVLPEQTADDVEPDGRGDGGTSHDEWLRRQVPPHHGG